MVDEEDLVKLEKVHGFEDRSNDLIYGKPLKALQNEQDVVVFFGGDVQDFEILMQNHEEHSNYVEWSLENTCRILRNKFPNSHIIVVRPSRIEFQTYSCFDNFVSSDKYGIPDHVPMNNSLQHLNDLLKSITERIPQIPNLDKFNLKLIGFSKGCVVLNQFLYEFEYYERTQISSSIIARIKDVYWLDGGHSGKNNTWVTSTIILESFSKLGIHIHIHVTPYQMKDDNRPWLKKEKNIFLASLKSLHAPVCHVLHYANLEKSLHLHFKLIKDFQVKC